MRDTPIGKLMLVDDAKMDQMMYRRVIARSGAVREIVSFYYASEALDYLRSPEGRDVDMILLDVNMPRMNGFEFLETAEREVWVSGTPIVVVMLTTSLHPDDTARAKGFASVKAYLHKPLDAEKMDVLVGLTEAAPCTARAQ